MSDRRGTKSKIREIVRREERNMRLVCCGGWSLWWWLWDRKLGACPEQLGAAAAAYTCAASSWWPSRKRGDPPAWGKTRETTLAWLVGGHNAKILNLKTGQLPSLEVVQGMQSAGKQSGGVLVPSTPRGMVLASLAANFWPTIKLSEEPFRCTGPMMREEREGAVGCDV